MVRFTNPVVTRRRCFTALSCSSASLWTAAAPSAPPGASMPGKTVKGRGMDNHLPPAVQLQFMRPAQIEAAARRFPVVYVPFGTIEWHGRHLPVGCDAIKAHGILVKCAERYGGVVHPPVYFHDGFPREHLEPLLTHLFNRLQRMGFRVIMGISGHNVKGQIAMVEAALKPVIADGSIAGIGAWEVSLTTSKETGTDHAASWETSDMQFLYPNTVDLAALGTGPIKLDMSKPDGIGGLDPRLHASAKKGARNVELCADAIGLKARELLNSLPADKREFGLKSISSENWWIL
jgi:creatinine amidohydrolase